MVTRGVNAYLPTHLRPPDPIRRTRLAQELRNLWRFFCRGKGVVSKEVELTRDRRKFKISCSLFMAFIRF
jgi:hypothetical protein